jgi:transcriptional regulator with AAA-type ATPase domain
MTTFVRPSVYTSAVPGERTESLPFSMRQPPGIDWTLIIAMDCQALTTWPESVSLAGASSVAIGRGAERKVVANGKRIQLDLPDRWISLNHARLVRSGDRWSIEDEGSRNGSRVNGERIDKKTLEDGDVLECGGTFLVLRRTDGRGRGGGKMANAVPLAQRPEALRTLSPTLDHELNVLRKVASSPVAVLVLGESGTGKEGMASAIHALSGRDGPFLAVNCGAIPATLIESELFGSRRGAFSGAEDRPGLVQRADRGTLFLDEVAELPMASQAALLRVLQEKELVPLGGSRPLKVDVRVVAATNRPVAEFIEEDKLRRDLYARLSGYELRLPPLRERREDLGLLVATLIARHDKSGAPRTLSRTAAWSLFVHSWPLNIRELEQCLATAVAVAGAGAEIGLEHLPRPIRDATTAPVGAAADERERLTAIIERLGGNLSAVARELGTSRSQLYRLLSRHSILPDGAKRSTPPTESE